MKNLMRKELVLAASPISLVFILFSAMAMIPGYPILVGAFFLCFGIFQSVQSACASNDILYTVLLPVKKTDVVKAKYGFAVLIQMLGFTIMAILTLLRMTLLPDAAPYTQNAMMNANQFFLAGSLLVFALFNGLFLGGFFKTADRYGKPFLLFSIASFLWVVAAETLHHIPGLEFLNGTATLCDGRLWLILVLGLAVYIGVTLAACRTSIKRFEAVDM